MVAFDELIRHESHPQHTLKLKYEEKPYKCDFCKELGFHTRYSCEDSSCRGSVHLHAGCAEASGRTFQHPFFKGCNFFLNRTGMPRRVCDACRMDVKGAIYHCYDCDRDLHPCCAHLERRIEDGDHLVLNLRKEMPSKCYLCGEKKLQGRSTWAYVSAADESCSLHIACVKKQMLDTWMMMQHINSSGREGKEEEDYCSSSSTDQGETAGVDQGDGRRRALVMKTKRTPMLQLPVGAGETRGAAAASGKLAKIKKTVKIAMTFIIAAILGDPTAFAAGLICNLIFR